VLKEMKEKARIRGSAQGNKNNLNRMKVAGNKETRAGTRKNKCKQTRMERIRLT
jgi:hypothetical protein